MQDRIGGSTWAFFLSTMFIVSGSLISSIICVFCVVVIGSFFFFCIYVLSDVCCGPAVVVVTALISIFKLPGNALLSRGSIRNSPSISMR